MKKLLVVVDMQKDFVDGALGSEEAQKIVPAVVNKVQSYIDRKDGIIFTKDTHTENYLQTQEGKNLPVIHCVQGTQGWEICDELQEFTRIEGNKTYEKVTFGSKQLAEELADIKDLEEVELCGLCTDICVISNALLIKAFHPEVKVTVDATCCAGVTPQSHRNALEAMKMCQVHVIGE
jgi:nicotinamidase-related amidase